MIETIPARPWTSDFTCFKQMEHNLTQRRQLIDHFYSPDAHVIALTTFPLLGCRDFTYPPRNPPAHAQTDKFESLFFANDVIYNNDFCHKYTDNKAMRCGQLPAIYVPVFIDENTPQPFVEDLGVEEKKAKPNEIYMDHDGFGFGCTCLQVTFQLGCMEEAAYVYDQLSALSPLLLAMSASSPIWRGFLAGVDTRWSCLSQSSEDRRPEEMGRVGKRRVDVTECYVGKAGREMFNDEAMPRDESVFNRLVEEVRNDEFERFYSYKEG